MEGKEQPNSPGGLDMDPLRECMEARDRMDGLGRKLTEYGAIDALEHGVFCSS
jgi:hypothetical protein